MSSSPPEKPPAAAWTQWLERMYLFSHANDGSRRGGMGHGLVDRFLGQVQTISLISLHEPEFFKQICAMAAMSVVRCTGIPQRYWIYWRCCGIFWYLDILDIGIPLDISKSQNRAKCLICSSTIPRRPSEEVGSGNTQPRFKGPLAHPTIIPCPCLSVHVP